MPTFCCSMKDYTLPESGHEAWHSIRQDRHSCLYSIFLNPGWTDRNACPANSLARVSQVSRIQGNIKFGGESLRIERAAGKIAAINVERRNHAPAIIHFEDNFFRKFVFLDVHLAEAHAALL